jgi:invasion protein IalB
MKIIAFLSAACLPFAGASATAQTSSQQPAQAQPQQAAASSHYDGNKIVCEKQEVVGSRLATKRICMTRDEWARARGDDKAWIDRVQQPGFTSAPQ